MISLRPYQTEAIAAVASAYRRGVRRPLIGLPTGCGKTVVFSSMVQGTASKGRRALILAHRDELLAQAADKLTQVAPELALRIGFVKGSTDDHDHDVVIASVQTLQRQARIDRILRPFDLIIIDEAHHAAAESYQRILRGLGCLEEGGPLTVGVTATPQRADHLDLSDTFQEIVYHKTMLEMMRANYLCDLRGQQVTLEGLDLAGVKKTAGDYNVGELGDRLEAADLPQHAATAWRKYARGRKTIAFTPTIALAQEMAAEFTKIGVNARALSGNTPLEERREMLRAFHTGEVQVIANAQVLTEGFDEPGVECILLARPTTSQGLYVQMVGRGTRLSPGKKDCLVLDMVGASDRLDLVTLPRLFGLGDPPKGGEATGSSGSIVEGVNEFEERERKAGRMVAKQVDLFQQQDLAWVHAGDGHWVLGLGGETVHLRADGAKWNVTVFSNARGSKGRILAEGLDQGYAMGVGDDYARGASGDRTALIDRSAPWRSRPASDKQLTHLRKRKVPIPDGMTAGEASDALSALFARGRA